MLLAGCVVCVLPLGSFVSSGVVAARYGVVGSGGSPVVFSGVGTDGGGGAMGCVGFWISSNVFWFVGVSVDAVMVKLGDVVVVNDCVNADCATDVGDCV